MLDIEKPDAVCLVSPINNIAVLNIKGSDLNTGSEMFETAGFCQENVSYLNINAGRKPTVNPADSRN